MADYDPNHVETTRKLREELFEAQYRAKFGDAATCPRCDKQEGPTDEHLEEPRHTECEWYWYCCSMCEYGD